MHCKACDKPLQSFEIYFDSRTGELENLCYICKHISIIAARFMLTDQQARALSRKAAQELSEKMSKLEER